MYIARYEILEDAGLDIKDMNDNSPSLEMHNENYWVSLQVNTTNVDSMLLPKEGVYEPQRIWERPAGHAVKGVDAFKLRCHVNALREPAVTVIGGSGAAPMLISDKFLKSLMASKPKPRTGNKLKLLQLTGSAECSEYVKLDLYFRSQLGPVRLKGVEAYIVKGMDANLLIGEDMQLAWQLHTIRPEGKRHWKVGDLPHCIPEVQGSVPRKAFTASWAPASTPATTIKPQPTTKSSSKKKRIQWNAIAKQQLTILPESIATITAVSRGAPSKEAMYLEGISLK
jgi:hypothetical protein